MENRQPTTARNRSAEALRDARAALGLSITEAARRVGVSTQTLRRYEREGLTGRVVFSRFMAVSRVYGIGSRELYGMIKQAV